MAQEIEAKILNIDVVEIEKKLKAIGAVRKGEKFFKSISCDYPGFPLDKNNSWVRLRDEGDKVNLAYKRRLVTDNTIGKDVGMEEVEVTVSDFETTKEFLLKIGLVVKFAQEKKRVTWEKDNVTFDIDTWPRLPTYLEVEGESWEEVDAAILALGLKLEDKKICSTTQIYEMAGIRDKDYIKMTFSEFVKRDS
jgi:adenylate cyclase, class 2